MSEIDYTKKGVPTKEEVTEYLNTSQILPLNIQAIWFELLKLNRRVEELEKANGK